MDDNNQEPHRSVRPVTLKFEDIVYKVTLNPDKSIWTNLVTSRKEPEERTILKGITGVVKPGEILAMLGPSGSGKTTLLTALGGRLSGTLTGSITYNAKAFSKSAKRNMGFVTQDDVLHPHLTVTETLVFTALLRLPRSMSSTSKVQHVDAIISELGLTACRNSIIGGSIVRGVSGGERKRVSIGQEMLINPSLLFLDEPTSGLDSTTAQRILLTLANLCRRGRTIITTIHQPFSRLYYMFHKVLLLSDGRPLYFGKASSALEYFSSIGYEANVPMNPADFLLDLANGISSEDISMDQTDAVKQALTAAYNEHLDFSVNQEVHEAIEHLQSAGNETKRDGDGGEVYQSTWWQQFTIIWRRSLKERRHQSLSGIRIFQVLGLALVCGLIWFRSSRNNVHDQVGLLFFCCTFWGFYPLFHAVFTFPEERRMLTKERASGMYRLSSYFMAQMAVDLPMELLLPTIFTVIIYWMGSLNPCAFGFFMTLSSILFFVLVVQGMGQMMGALVMDVEIASTLADVLMLTSMIAGGFYVQSMPVFMEWFKYASVTSYGFKLLLRAQYSPDQTYECSPGATCRVPDQTIVKTVGLNNLGLAVGILSVMLVCFRLIAVAEPREGEVGPPPHPEFQVSNENR